MPSDMEKYCAWCDSNELLEVMVHGGGIPVICKKCGSNKGHITYKEINTELTELRTERDKARELLRKLSDMIPDWHSECDSKHKALIKETNLTHTLQEKLDDWQESHSRVINEPCREDEIHCTCVPPLRREVTDLKEQLADKDSLISEAVEVLELTMEWAKIWGKTKINIFVNLQKLLDKLKRGE